MDRTMTLESTAPLLGPRVTEDRAQPAMRPPHGAIASAADGALEREPRRRARGLRSALSAWRLAIHHGQPTRAAYHRRRATDVAEVISWEDAEWQ